jgi:hypothetical protein
MGARYRSTAAKESELVVLCGRHLMAEAVGWRRRIT